MCEFTDCYAYPLSRTYSSSGKEYFKFSVLGRQSVVTRIHKIGRILIGSESQFLPAPSARAGGRSVLKYNTIMQCYFLPEALPWRSVDYGACDMEYSSGLVSATRAPDGIVHVCVSVRVCACVCVCVCLFTAGAVELMLPDDG